MNDLKHIHEEVSLAVTDGIKAAAELVRRNILL
jgi:hypothetical protein